LNTLISIHGAPLFPLLLLTHHVLIILIAFIAVRRLGCNHLLHSPKFVQLVQLPHVLTLLLLHDTADLGPTPHAQLLLQQHAHAAAAVCCGHCSRSWGRKFGNQARDWLGRNACRCGSGSGWQCTT
jgi:hypothetical protein